jgi:hypothetical protein
MGEQCQIFLVSLNPSQVFAAWEGRHAAAARVLNCLHTGIEKRFDCILKFLGAFQSVVEEVRISIPVNQ